MTGAFKILSYMLDHPDILTPWTAKGISNDLKVPEQTVYKALKTLVSYDLVKHLSAGYQLSGRVLGAGVKYETALSKLASPKQFKELQEALYGK